MKPVLRTVIDKNGGEETVFEPTALMILYSIYRGKNPGMNTTEVCKLTGIEPGLPGKWAAKYGSYFMNWVEEAIEAQTGEDAAILERVGMIRATQAGGFPYWKEMARTKGVIKEEAPRASLTINTDFSQILIAVGGDINAARQRILSAHRGVADQGEPGLVRASGRGEHPGAGSGAGGVQDGPVALPDPLGPDGGRAEQREPVPAVPERPAFAGSYEVLEE